MSGIASSAQIRPSSKRTVSAQASLNPGAVHADARNGSFGMEGTGWGVDIKEERIDRGAPLMEPIQDQSGK
jgi:hypothetical protein